MNDIDLGIVTMGEIGWGTVRKQWEQDLSDYAPRIEHIEDHARFVKSLTDRYGARSIGANLAGRAAARAAIRAGAKVILFTTLQNAAFLPLPKGVRHLIYGDCTDAQLVRLYNGQEPHFPGSWISRRIRRLADRGCYFLCMTEWYRGALRDEFGISEDRLVYLPFYMDTDKWAAPERKQPNARKQVLFIGGDLRRKGADIVYALARLEKFSNVDFHIVSPRAEPGPENLHAHRSLRGFADLIGLAAQCDVFILPTRADTFSHAAMEAATCEVPAIITRRGGIPELVVDGVTGSVLPEPEADLFEAELSRYLADPELTAQRGRNARQHVERNYSKKRHFAILRETIARAAAEMRA